MKLEPMTEAEASKVYKAWLNTPGSANEFDLIRMAVAARDAQWQAAILADREKRAQPVEYQVLGFVSRYGTEIHDTLEAATPGQPVYVRIATEASKPVQAEAPHSDLMKFYSVDNLSALVEAQHRHIEKLQAKLPRNDQPAFTRVREG